MRKLCLTWVPRLLTVDQKQQHTNDSEHCLQLFQCNKREFLCKYMTMDEPWIHCFTPESNWQSAEWTVAGESHPRRPKTQISAGKALASVFWDVQDILFIGYLEKGRTVNSKYYIALLVCLKEEIKKQPLMKKKKCPFTKTMHDVTSQLQQRQNYMNCTSNCFCPHPILQIWDLKRMLQGKIFDSNEVISKTEVYFEAKDKLFYKKGIELLEALESVYYPRKRLCWWIKSNFA